MIRCITIIVIGFLCGCTSPQKGKVEVEDPMLKPSSTEASIDSLGTKIIVIDTVVQTREIIQVSTFNLVIDGFKENLDAKEEVELFFQELEEVSGNIEFPSILYLKDSMITISNTFGSAGRIQKYNIVTGEMKGEIFSNQPRSNYASLHDALFGIQMDKDRMELYTDISFKDKSDIWLLLNGQEVKVFEVTHSDSVLIADFKTAKQISIKGYLNNSKIVRSNNMLYVVNEILQEFLVYDFRTETSESETYKDYNSNIIGFTNSLRPIFLNYNSRIIRTKKDGKVVEINLTTDLNANKIVSAYFDNDLGKIYFLLLNENNLDISLGYIEVSL